MFWNFEVKLFALRSVADTIVEKSSKLDSFLSDRPLKVSKEEEEEENVYIGAKEEF